MRDTVELVFDRLGDFWVLVPMEVRPDRRVRINVLTTICIPKNRPLPRFNDDRFLRHPVLHLRERMPEVTVILVCNRGHFSICHPEGSEGSHSVREILRFAQNDIEIGKELIDVVSSMPGGGLDA